MDAEPGLGITPPLGKFSRYGLAAALDAFRDGGHDAPECERAAEIRKALMTLELELQAREGAETVDLAATVVFQKNSTLRLIVDQLRSSQASDAPVEAAAPEPGPAEATEAPVDSDEQRGYFLERRREDEF